MTILREDAVHRGAAGVRPEIRALRPYRLPQAGPSDDAVRLHQNEAPEDWPPSIKQEITAQLLAQPWHRYPGMRADAVCDALGVLQGTPAARVVPAAGSNDALRGVFAAFAAGGTIVMPSPTYSMSRTLALVAGARVVEVPLEPAFSLPVEALLAAAHAHRADLIYLASPNNPTGNAFSREAVTAVLEGAPGAVVIDEAYWEFTGDNWLGDLDRYPHLVVVRTFSKAMAGAGLRLGWITAQEPVVDELVKVLPPYSLNVFVQVAAPVLVARREAAAARVRDILAERPRVAAALEDMGVRVYPSETNFVLFEPAYPPAAVWDGLAARGVLVRDVSGSPALASCLRVSIGSRTANDRFLAALSSVRAALEASQR
jgi:histidinol-phosphate aminotransferase